MSYDFFKQARLDRQAGSYPALSEEESERRKSEFLALLPPREDVWFFGYGSLMWDPGFDHLEAAVAELDGWHRSFCVLSHRYRGSPERPGLVLGLDQGGLCTGMAYRVCGVSQLEQVVDYLWVREMVTGIYDPMSVPATLGGTRKTACWAFVVNRQHPQYMGHLEKSVRAEMIARAIGGRGPNIEYLDNTLERLATMGVEDSGLGEMRQFVGSALEGGER